MKMINLRESRIFNQYGCLYVLKCKAADFDMLSLCHEAIQQPASSNDNILDTK